MVVGMEKIVKANEQLPCADGIVNEVPLAIGRLPLGVAVLATVVAGLGDVPVDD